MEMSNCLRCKKLFPKFKEPICEACKKKDEELFERVKGYLEANPTSTVVQISAETGASAKKILTWLREGRLELTQATGDLKCRQCGVDLTTGQFCEACFVEINRQIEGIMGDVKPVSVPDVPTKKGIVMHTKKRK